MDNKDLDKDLMEKLDRKDLEKEMDMRDSVKSDHQCTSDCNNTKDCPVCPHGYDEENFCKECDEITGFESPYRHIEEANEENYKATDKSNE